MRKTDRLSCFAENENMLKKDQWLIRQADLDNCADMICRENRTAFRVMAMTGCVLSVFNLITQIVITGFGMPIFRSSLRRDGVNRLLQLPFHFFQLFNGQREMRLLLFKGFGPLLQQIVRQNVHLIVR